MMMMSYFAANKAGIGSMYAVVEP